MRTKKARLKVWEQFTGKREPTRWYSRWYYCISFGSNTHRIEVTGLDYKTKQSALAAGRRMAKRLGLEVEK